MKKLSKGIPANLRGILRPGDKMVLTLRLVPHDRPSTSRNVTVTVSPDGKAHATGCGWWNTNVVDLHSKVVELILASGFEKLEPKPATPPVAEEEDHEKAQ